MGNVKAVSKKFKNFRFFWRKLARKIGKKISKHAAHVISAPSISAKTLAFPSLL